MSNIAFKFRIYPNTEQSILLSKTFGCVRFVYNKMLEEKISYYNETGETLKVTPAKYKKEYGWLKEVDSLALANAQMNLQKAYANFFRDNSVCSPKYKSKHKSKMSYTTNMVNGNIRLTDKHLHLPKVGDVKCKVHRKIPDDYKIKSVTVSKTPCSFYFASILCEYKEPVIDVEYTGKEIGLDYSMPELYIDSYGNQPNYPKYFRQMEKKLAKEQRKLSKKKEEAKKEKRLLKD